MRVRNYLEDAKKHEEVFRNILRNLEIEERDLSLDEIYRRYSNGILDFRVGPYADPIITLSHDEALFGSQNIGFLSGRGNIAKYKIGENNSVSFISNPLVWMS